MSAGAMQFFMVVYHFVNEELENGHLIPRAKIKVMLSGKKASMSFLALLDSGADITIIPRSVADFLGIKYDFKSTQRFFDFSKHPHQCATGNVDVCFEDDITIKDVPVLVALSGEEYEPVLGCEKIFDSFKIIFDKRKEIILEE